MEKWLCVGHWRRRNNNTTCTATMSCHACVPVLCLCCVCVFVLYILAMNVAIKKIIYGGRCVGGWPLMMMPAVCRAVIMPNRTADQQHFRIIIITSIIRVCLLFLRLRPFDVCVLLLHVWHSVLMYVFCRIWMCII